MSPAEERLRAAARAVAVTVPEDSVPPLRLTAARLHDAGFRGPGRRWSGWLAPLAAAAAVVAVIAMSVAVAGGHISGAHAGTRTGPEGTPPYYVALTAATGQARPGAAAVVRLTATGRPVARVVPPQRSGGFTMVSAASDDRTFVLGTQVTAANISPVGLSLGPAGRPLPGGFGFYSPAYVAPVPRTEFFLLRFNPSRQQTRLSPLRLPPVRQRVSGLALSPDGKRLAVALSPPGQLKIMVSALATGSGRTWAGPVNHGPPPAAPRFLSWAPDGRTLAFDWSVTAGHGKGRGAALAESVRLLNTAAPGTSLVADSIPAPGISGTWPAVSPQILPVPFRGRPPAIGVAAGRPPRGQEADPVRDSVRIVKARGLTVTQPLWANAMGSVLIVSLFRPEIGIVGHGRYTRLPATMPANPLGIAW